MVNTVLNRNCSNSDPGRQIPKGDFSTLGLSIEALELFIKHDRSTVEVDTKDSFSEAGCSPY